MWTWRKIWFAAATTLTAVMLIVVLVDQVVLPWIVSMTPTVTVPSVIGMTEADGKQLLSNSGLNVVQIREQYNDKIPSGRILSQLPQPNAVVKDGRRAYLIISKGIERIRVPRLIGYYERDARLTLMKSGLLLGSVTLKPDSLVEPGVVIEQSVAEGTPIQREAVIDIVMSTGFGSPVPDVVGLSLDDAQNELLANGYIIGNIIRKPSTVADPGTVLGQYPKADSLASMGTAIRLIIAE